MFLIRIKIKILELNTNSKLMKTQKTTLFKNKFYCYFLKIKISVIFHFMHELIVVLNTSGKNFHQ